MQMFQLQVQVILDRFPALQPEQIIVRDASCYSQQLQSALGSVSRDGFDIVLDAISGEYFQTSYQALARGGRHVIFGAANWTPTGAYKLCMTCMTSEMSDSYFGKTCLP